MADFLLEFFSEEIPAMMQKRASDDLARLAKEALAKVALAHKDIQTFAENRRLTLHVTGLPAKTEDQSEERRGPRVGCPPAALDGFLKGAGVTEKDLITKDSDKGSFYFVMIDKKGQETAAILPAFIQDIFNNFPWPKSMRWGKTSATWIRPLRSVLAIFDGQKLAGGLDLGGEILAFSNSTIGSRSFNKELIIKDFNDYKAQLADNGVVLESDVRRQRILDGGNQVAAAKNLTVVWDEKILEENIGMNPFPRALLGHFDESFLSVPPEILTTSMKHHQKYFPLQDKNGALAPYFLCITSHPNPKADAMMIAGHERVLRARLSDAAFFYEQDCKIPLDDPLRFEALAARTEHMKIGNMFEKVKRIKKLAIDLAEKFDVDAKLAARAAVLSKCDLVTGVVGEFPELQGVMGAYYAKNEPKDVALAIKEHYKPQGVNDSVPATKLGAIVALADKIDQLREFFKADEIPTGSKDPYALRRSVLGVIRIAIEHNFNLKPWDIFGDDDSTDKVKQLLETFIKDRFIVMMRDEGFSYDAINSVIDQNNVFIRTKKRLKAMHSFLDTEDGKKLLAGYKRASNILKGTKFSDYEQEKYLSENAEIVLHNLLKTSDPQINIAINNEDFVGAMKIMADLRTAVDDFFDKIMVNVDDATIRENRQKLVFHVQNLMDGVANFSKIEG